MDKKTGITTVTVTLQDPMVTAAITDTVIQQPVLEMPSDRGDLTLPFHTT